MYILCIVYSSIWYVYSVYVYSVYVYSVYVYSRYVYVHKYACIYIYICVHMCVSHCNHLPSALEVLHSMASHTFTKLQADNSSNKMDIAAFL